MVMQLSFDEAPSLPAAQLRVKREKSRRGNILTHHSFGSFKQTKGWRRYCPLTIYH
jgi:hypothetical protein